MHSIYKVPLCRTLVLYKWSNNPLSVLSFSRMRECSLERERRKRTRRISMYEKCKGLARRTEEFFCFTRTMRFSEKVKEKTKQERRQWEKEKIKTSFTKNQGPQSPWTLSPLLFIIGKLMKLIILAQRSLYYNGLVWAKRLRRLLDPGCCNSVKSAQPFFMKMNHCGDFRLLPMETWLASGAGVLACLI